VRDACRGSAHARNAGISHACADILAITNDDCIPAQDWLSHILTAFEGRPEVLPALWRSRCAGTGS
jgi:hypothetical protein